MLCYVMFFFIEKFHTLTHTNLTLMTIIYTYIKINKEKEAKR